MNVKYPNAHTGEGFLSGGQKSSVGKTPSPKCYQSVNFGEIYHSLPLITRLGACSICCYSRMIFHRAKLYSRISQHAKPRLILHAISESFGDIYDSELQLTYATKTIPHGGLPE